MGCSSSAADASAFQEEFQIGDKLGEGAFSQVWKVSATERRRARHEKQHSSGRECVVKIIDLRFVHGLARSNRSSGSFPCAPITSEETAKRCAVIKNEVSVQHEVGAHPNILQMVAHFWTESHCYLVMEQRRCSLVDFIAKEAPANEAEMACLFRQMLLALAHVHGCAVVHGNVQPRSFVVGGQDGRTLKLTNFGASTKLTGFSLNAGDDRVLRGNRGAPEFAAPEVLRGETYGSKADVWSFGVIAHLMLYWEHPYLPSAHAEQAIFGFGGLLAPRQQPGSAFSLAWERSRDSQNFVREILAHDPEKRPSARCSLAMPLLDLGKSEEWAS